MAAANKPTAVHFSLVVFVTATLVLGVFTYLGWQKNREKETLLAQKDKELGELKSLSTKHRTETDALKLVIGSQLPEIGADVAGADTVIGAMAAANSPQGPAGPQAQSNILASMIAMRTYIDNLEAERAQLQAALNQNQTQFTSLESNALEKVAQIQTSQSSTEQQLQANIAARQKAIDEKNAELAAITKERNESQSRVGMIQDDYDRFKRDTSTRIVLLDKQINFYKSQLDELTKQGFEREDGAIVSVDNTTRTVWINIGSAETLKPQVSFSVFTSDHRGIGRGVEDIKAKIEVTRILQPHLAEARILDEDLFRPIQEGDPIYSPLWTAGRKEYFAVVGRPDLNDDGQSDWDLFRELIATAGAELDVIIDDQAQRVPADAKLSARTKFLIVGDIDDPAKFSGIPDKQKLALDIQKQLDALTDEARLYGIRVVRLNDFLDYIGYKPQQRLWQPGTGRDFNLREGTQGKAVDETYQDRSSGGITSEVYRKNRTGRQQQSDGVTSELFRSK